MAGSEWEMVGQVVLAAALAGILGWERQRRGQPAGLRTYMLVAIAAANFTQVGIHSVFVRDLNDPMRIAAQVVTGIGFLGAGAIWRTGTAPRGLTTAAGLWVSAALGLLAAGELYALAIATTVLAWVILRGGYALEQMLGVKRDPGAPDSGDDDGSGAAHD